MYVMTFMTWHWLWNKIIWQTWNFRRKFCFFRSNFSLSQKNNDLLCILSVNYRRRIEFIYAINRRNMLNRFKKANDDVNDINFFQWTWNLIFVDIRIFNNWMQWLWIVDSWHDRITYENWTRKLNNTMRFLSKT